MDLCTRNNLLVESDAISGKIDQLHEYMVSPKFQTLSLVGQTLLDTQLDIMNAYHKILAARVREAGGL